MGRKRKTLFTESASLNDATFNNYLIRLTELAISMWEWSDLPATVDERYMELRLFETGSAIFFFDDVMGYLCLDMLYNGTLNVYGEPLLRRAYSAYNNYQILLKNTNSVIIWNNMLRMNTIPAVQLYATMLYNLDRIAMINANAQKTPVLINATEQQKLTLLNLYKEYDGNQPFIFGNKNIDVNVLKVLQTNAPYVADKIYTLKTQIWNEALTYLGISNVNYMKKERMITDEVLRSMGGTIASRRSREKARKQAVKKINNMFGLNISVEYASDFDDAEVEMPDATQGGDVA